MWKNHLVVSWRSLRRQGIFSLLNIVGLGIGLAAVLLAGSYIKDDLTWDRFHEHYDSIYRVNQLQEFAGIEPQHVGLTAAPIAAEIVQAIPEVTHATRVAGKRYLVERNDVRIYQWHMTYVDSSFFNIFSFDLAQGDKKTALLNPDNIILNQELAKTYFGEENPIGQTIRLDGKRDAIVTGILADPPAGSAIRINALLPFNAYNTDHPNEDVTSWGRNYLTTYVRIVPGASLEIMNEKLKSFLELHRSLEHVRFYFQPFSDLHLHSEFVRFQRNNGQSSWSNLITFGAIALFLLLIACINYMNLSTARSLSRSREVGMRKVVGAGRLQLVRQFMMESLVVTSLAMLIAIVLTEIIEPHFAAFAGREVAVNVLDGGFGTVLVASTLLLTAFFAGLYPAFVLSAHHPSAILKGVASSGTGGHALLRRALVILQFTITTGFLIATGIVLSQMHYSKTKDLGYTLENVLCLNLPDERFAEHAEEYRARFAAIPGVVAASSVSDVPGFGHGQTSIYIPDTQEYLMAIYLISDEYTLDTFDFSLTSGRFFDPSFPSDRQYETDGGGAFVINEAMAKKLGWENPIGKFVGNDAMKGTIVGVVKDFNFESLHTPIEPLIFINSNFWKQELALRFRTENLQTLMADVEAVWEEIYPDKPIHTYFIDDSLERMYRAEMRFGRLLNLFAILTITIACLGLLSLTAYSLQRRTKEIGIRKVLGASVSQIMQLVCREFLTLILLANALAWPLAYFTMEHWLNQFHYRIATPFWIFPLATLASFIFATVVIYSFSLRAAHQNPVLSLRHD